MTRPDEFPLRPSQQARQAPKPLSGFQNQTKATASRPTDVRLPSTPRFSSPDEWPSASLPLPNPRRLLQGGAFAPRPDEGTQLGPRRDTFFPPASGLPRPDEEAQRPLLRHARNEPSAKSVPLVDGRPDAWATPRPLSPKPSPCASTSFRYPDEHGPCCSDCTKSAASPSSAAFSRRIYRSLSPDSYSFSFFGTEFNLHYGNGWGPIYQRYTRYFSGYNTGAIHGRAVGSFDNSSSWLIGGPYLVTSAHGRPEHNGYPGVNFQRTRWSCEENPVFNKTSTTEASFLFGRTLALDRKGEDSIEYLHGRLLDLGIPFEAVGNYKKIERDYKTLDILRYFDCNQIETSYRRAKVQSYPDEEFCRDLDYYHCVPKEIVFSEIDATSGRRVPDRVSLFPSHLYGSIPLSQKRESMYKERTAVYLLSRNNVTAPNGTTANQPLLSYKGSITWSPYQDLEATGLMFRAGSSGGALMDTATNTAIGILSGSVVVLPQLQVNAYTHKIPPKAYELAQRAQTNPSSLLPTSQRISFTPWEGGRGAQATYMKCPASYFAAGIVGSTVRSPVFGDVLGLVGNLGLVCLPFTKTEHYQFEKSVVIAGGSIDTQQEPHYQIPIDRYLAEYLTDEGPYAKGAWLEEEGAKVYIPQKLRKQQQLTMCPPGHYMTGLWVEPGFDFSNNVRLVRRVYRVNCSRWDGKVTTSRVPRIPIGGEGGERFYFGSPNQCPSGYFVEGISIGAGWFTDGFQFLCRKGIP